LWYHLLLLFAVVVVVVATLSMSGLRGKSLKSRSSIGFATTLANDDVACPAVSVPATPSVMPVNRIRALRNGMVSLQELCCDWVARNISIWTLQLDAYTNRLHHFRYWLSDWNSVSDIVKQRVIDHLLINNVLNVKALVLLLDANSSMLLLPNASNLTDKCFAVVCNTHTHTHTHTHTIALHGIAWHGMAWHW
jgi:hypothetical protein